MKERDKAAGEQAQKQDADFDVSRTQALRRGLELPESREGLVE